MQTANGGRLDLQRGQANCRNSAEIRPRDLYRGAAQVNGALLTKRSAPARLLCIRALWTLWDMPDAREAGMRKGLTKEMRKSMHPIIPGDRKIVSIHSADYTPFVYDDGVALGDSVLQLNDELPLGIGFHVYRMPAGMTSRPHRHNGHEQFLILEGELVENDGTVLKPGDLVWFRDGTEHCSHSPNGCLLAVHIAGPEVT
eukprot:gene60035-82129_t